MDSGEGYPLNVSVYMEHSSIGDTYYIEQDVWCRSQGGRHSLHRAGCMGLKPRRGILITLIMMYGVETKEGDPHYIEQDVWGRS